MSIAVKTSDDRIFIEGIDCRPMRDGIEWILGYLNTMDIEKVVVDGANGQKILESQMKEYHMKKPILPTVKEIITANSVFEQGLYQRTICHAKQKSLMAAASNCEKRLIGTNGGFGYRAIKEGIEIAILDSVILAHWKCSEKKTNKKQRVSY